MGDLHKHNQDWLYENGLNILNSVADAIVAIDHLGTILFVNDATERTFQYTADEMLGQSMGMLMPEPFRSEHRAYVKRYMDSGDAHIIGKGLELTARKKDGSPVPIYLAVNEIKTEDKIYFAGIMRDLTEHKQNQSALLEQRERVARVGRLSTMGEMTASIAHEINQPLTAIAAYSKACTNLLGKQDCDLQRVKDGLRKLKAQSLRAGSVIERIQRLVGQEGTDRELVDINQLMHELMPLIEPDVRLREVSLEFDLADELPMVFCDSVQIQQVTLNLIRNAIDAMLEIDCRQGNQIFLRTRLQDSSVEVSISDQGPGVAEKDQALVFSPFHSTKVEGMGMGLSICRSIMEQHGGSLDFRNNDTLADPSSGATFYFLLPVELPVKAE